MLLAWPLQHTPCNASKSIPRAPRFPSSPILTVAATQIPTAVVIEETCPCTVMVDTLAKDGKRPLPPETIANIHDMSDAQLFNILNGKKSRRATVAKRPLNPSPTDGLLSPLGRPNKRLRRTYLHVYSTLANVQFGEYQMRLDMPTNDTPVTNVPPTGTCLHGDDSASDTTTPSAPDDNTLPFKLRFKHARHNLTADDAPATAASAMVPAADAPT